MREEKGKENEQRTKDAWPAAASFVRCFFFATRSPHRPESHGWVRDVPVWLPLACLAWGLAWKFQDEFIADWDGFDYSVYTVRHLPSALGLSRGLFLGYNYLLWEAAHRWFGIEHEHVYLVIRYGVMAQAGPAIVAFYAFGKELTADRLAAALGALLVGPPQIVNVGPRWVIAELPDEAAVRSLKPDLIALAAYDRAHGVTGQTIFARLPNGDAVVRSFAAADGIAEDPVCGSGNGAVAAYRRWSGTGGADYSASQGREIGRDGVISVRFDGDEIYVGGHCVTVIEGTVRI